MIRKQVTKREQSRATGELASEQESGDFKGGEEGIRGDLAIKGVEEFQSEKSQDIERPENREEKQEEVEDIAAGEFERFQGSKEQRNRKENANGAYQAVPEVR